MNCRTSVKITIIFLYFRLYIWSPQNNHFIERILWSIIRLLAYCKGGNFNIRIWAWFGYFICLGREIKVLFVSCLSSPNTHIFHENHGCISYTLNSHLLTLFSANHNKMSAYVLCRNVFEASMTNSVDPDQTSPAHSDLGSTLFLYLCHQ